MLLSPSHPAAILWDNLQVQCHSWNSLPTEKAEGEEPKGGVGGNLGRITEVRRFFAELPVQATSEAELTAPVWPLGQHLIEQVL